MPDDGQITRPERLLDIVAGALELAPSAREAFLDTACAGDAALRADAESLLRQDEPARHFIARPAIAAHARAFLETEGACTPAATLQAGQMLGDFRIGSLLGEGGMGEVYLAEDVSLGRLVAIKLVKAGIASPTLRQRFGVEMRILARLNDPHIARLYGGAVTPGGLPYFVMEYVEGERLDDYCDKRCLSIDARLGLFRKVCAAVSYAHQNLVIHRDLKPANIRVTHEGEPKLLDFGIAKLLDPQAESDTAQTVTQFSAMTPEYASPEQLRGEGVTTATDIYSLGVILYELLCGHRPFHPNRSRVFAEAPAIRREIVPRPSSVASGAEAVAARGTTRRRLTQQLAGDLDNIILMAMRAEPARRYPSVSQLADDLRRHLDGQPVAARKETLRYVGAKFVSRNRSLAVAAMLFVFALIGGIVATTWQAQRADEQRRSADRRFDQVRRLADSLMGEIHDSVQTLAGSTPTRKLIVTRALEYLDNLSKEADKPELRRDLAAAYEKIGNVQGNPYEPNLGDTDGALTSYRKAEHLLLAQASAGTTAPTEVRMALGRIDRALGDIFEVKGNYAGMIRCYRHSLEIFAGMQREKPSDPAVLDELARADITLGDGCERMENGQAEQLRCYEQALGYLQRLVTQNPGNAKYRRGLAVLRMKLGETYVPDKVRSVGYVTRAASDFKAISEENPDNARARRDYALGIFTLAWTLGETGDYEGAVSNHQKALVIREQIAMADPKDQQARYDLAAAHANLADALTKIGKPEQALGHARQAIAELEPLVTADPNNASYLRNGGLFYEKVGDALTALAGQESLDMASRHAHWTDARLAFQSASQRFSELSAKGPLRAGDASVPASLNSKIAKCEAGLKSSAK